MTKSAKVENYPEVTEGEEADTDKSGIVYLSRIPPTMTPHEIRGYLDPFGRIGRIYLTPDEKTLRDKKMASHDPRDRRKARFTEGWVEFVRKKDAKSVALALNGTAMGGKKSNRFHDDIWNIKYLKAFKWSNLNEEEIYERAVRQQRLRAEISQARKANSHYMKQVERAHEMKKIEEKRATKLGKSAPTVNVEAGQLEALKSKFRQRKPIIKADS